MKLTNPLSLLITLIASLTKLGNIFPGNKFLGALLYQICARNKEDITQDLTLL